MRAGRQCGESGQAAVETAIVMPLFVFLLLGMLQLGLVTHARVLAKYAAYRAVRIGAIQNADKQAMEAAAILHLLPVLANRKGVIAPTTSSSQVLSKFAARMVANSIEVPGAPAVTVAICGPAQSELRGTGGNAIPKGDQRTRWSRGSADEVDFDDPGLMIDDSPETGRGIRTFNRLRLRIQLQLLYRMPIPFANWIITQIYLGSTLPAVMMMEDGKPRMPNLSKQANKVRMASAQGVYVLPINVSYAMRMHSNFFLRRYQLPSKNECIHYGN
ncbi:pilus assembly protein [Myxococcaceae bacterium GXIMD 01537]